LPHLVEAPAPRISQVQAQYRPRRETRTDARASEDGTW